MKFAVKPKALIDFATYVCLKLNEVFYGLNFR